MDEELESGPTTSANDVSPLENDDDRATARFPADEHHAPRFKIGDEDLPGITDPNIGAADDDTIPEVYSIAPLEGMSIDQNLLKEATPVFRELKLTNGAVNKLMPLAGKVIERHVRSNIAEHEKLKKQWENQSRNDFKIGRENWGETNRLVQQALSAAGLKPGSKFHQLMAQSGLGNHPEVLRVFRVLGARVGEARNERHRQLSRTGYPSRSETRFGK